ncbi:MAG: hypothetical protein WCQ53_07065 [bacterium]
MAKFQKTKSAKILIGILVIALSGLILSEILREKPQTTLLLGKLPPLGNIEFNLRLLTQYNTPTGSVISDFRNLFAGEYSAPAFSIIKYDLTSALFLVLLPLFAMLGILLALGVSKRALMIVMAIFGVFTILPLILL